MNPGDPRPLLDRHAARILARWREQLRALPPSSALAAPELLNPLMAPALARVRHESAESGAATRPVAAEPDPCRCGLNPLVTFYLTGEFATFDVLWAQPDAFAPLPPEKREELCRRLRDAWHRVGREEIALFCSLCKRGEELHAQDHHAAPRAAQVAHAAPEPLPAAAHAHAAACAGKKPATISAWARAACEAAPGKP